MTQAKIYYGTVFSSGSVVLMARVIGYSNEVLHRYELDSASYSVYRLDIADESRKIPITGHTNVTLNLDNVFFDALQQDETWNADETGFNFRHVLDNSESEMFSLSHRFYQVEYTFLTQDSSRPPVEVRFRLFSL